MNLASKELCCGCSVCASVCPTGAISMQYDEAEFLYPSVDQKKCISCHLCEEKCPVIHLPDRSGQGEIHAYGGHFKDENKILQSSSGGFMTALAEKMIYSGGIVFGVTWNSDFTHAVYMQAETMEDLNPIKSSKYVMSEPNPELYISVKEQLKKGRRVLFTGCPCQITALKQYLGCDYDNLITAEVICQGATTPLSLRRYIESITLSADESVKALNMRGKLNKQWDPFIMQVELTSKAGERMVSIPFESTLFYPLFLNIKRESCYQCHSKLGDSVADLTAGDYHGINSKNPSIDDAGVSVIFSHTKKGQDYISDMSSFGFEMFESSLDEAQNIQACLYDPIKRTSLRKIFLDKISSGHVEEIMDIVPSAFNQILKKAYQKIEKDEFCYAIWGVGKYFEDTYTALQRLYPHATLRVIVDKYVEGVRHGIQIQKPALLEEINVDHVFITTVMGKDDAVHEMVKIFGIDAEKHYTLSML